MLQLSRLDVGGFRFVQIDTSLIRRINFSDDDCQLPRQLPRFDPLASANSDNFSISIDNQLLMC